MPPRPSRKWPDSRSEASNGLVLDAGALIAVERDRRRVKTLVLAAHLAGHDVVVPAGVLAQVWRNGARQALLARYLRSGVGAGTAPVVEPFDERSARWAGELCAASGSTDVVDASVVICARARRLTVLTSDPDDLLRLDPACSLIPV
jgi:hypothetical protein